LVRLRERKSGMIVTLLPRQCLIHGRG